MGSLGIFIRPCSRLGATGGAITCLVPSFGEWFLCLRISTVDKFVVDGYRKATNYYPVCLCGERLNIWDVNIR